MPFKLHSEYQPQGDQPQAIDALVRGLGDGVKDQVLLGITAVARHFPLPRHSAKLTGRVWCSPTNKTLPRSFLPGISKRSSRRMLSSISYLYYDYYQPEAYVPASDLYIEKEATINDEIDRLRMSATRALFERRDVIVVASVSCISVSATGCYYGHCCCFVEPGGPMTRDCFAPETGRTTVRTFRHWI